MWLKYFSVFIFIVVIIRLFLIATGEMTALEKMRKASSWIVGVILLVVSWNIINALFPNVNIGTFGDDEEANETNQQYEQSEFNRTNKGQDSTTVKIKFRGDK